LDQARKKKNQLLSKDPDRADLLLREKEARASGFRFIAGIDEAGRGPLAGPVVAAAVILKKHDFSVRIDDSKRLSPSARERAYQQISDRAIIGIGIVAEDIIDRINIYQATILAMEEAVLDLDIVPDILFIDGSIRLRLSCPQVGIIGGDQQSLTIACASIVAKVTRDRLLSFYDGLFPEYGFAKHKGYGTEGHIAALKEKGFSAIHRQTFKLKG
jgi:ribonuclease HII